MASALATCKPSWMALLALRIRILSNHVDKFGAAAKARMVTIVTTTNASINVKPRCFMIALINKSR